MINLRVVAVFSQAILHKPIKNFRNNIKQQTLKKTVLLSR